MKTRKLILLSSIAILLVVFVLQQIFIGGSKITYLNLKEEPSVVLIDKNGEEQIKLSKTGEDTFMLNDTIPADTQAALSIFSQIQSLKIIGTVANGVSNEAELERYGLQPLSAVAAAAQTDGKTVRTIKIGKAASSGSQTYAQIDGSNDVVLVSGSLRSYFDKSIDELTQKEEPDDEIDDSSGEGGDLLLNSTQE